MYAMGVDEFKELVNEFLQIFEFVKSLCTKIRDTLFSLLENKALFIGTSLDSLEQLYHFIIRAFDEAIVAKQNLEQAKIVSCVIHKIRKSK